MAEGTTYHFHVNAETAGGRLDQLIPQFVPDLSRSRGQALIGSGLVTVNDVAANKNYAVRQGDRVQVTLPPPIPATPQPENIPIQILHEDRNFVAVNKPAGMVVHPAPGHPGGTLVNALLAALPTLSGIGGVARPGIVHRLDKGTSGVVLVAKNDRAHRALAAQFAGREVEKTYLALAWGVLQENDGRWDAAIGRDRKDRQKISVRTRHPRAAVTRWHVLRRLPDSTLLEVHPETGRTHQIRVHLANALHPVLGDTTYAPRGGRESAYRRASIRHGFRDRLALHAWKIRFTPPAGRTPLEITAPPPPDLARLMENDPDAARESRRGDAKRGTPTARTEGSTVGVRSGGTPQAELVRLTRAR
jgi:23S rRNA pseudouridine1911/1915/1917 synthase